MLHRFVLILLVMATQTSATASAVDSSMQLGSQAYAMGASIPVLYTCDGKDISPPLVWHGVPSGTRSFVLIVDDPDAPGGTWVHWVLYNLPADSRQLPAAIKHKDLPAGTLTGTNSWGKTSYGGPCPPSGRHRYFHKLYALDTVLPKLDAATVTQLEKAMRGHVLASAELIATYQRSR